MSSYFGTLNLYVLGLSFLAFFASLIRETIKDAQDKEGDRRFGCRTIPIVLGEEKTKWYIIIMLLLFITFISLVQFYAFDHLIGLAIFLLLVSGLSVYSIINMIRHWSQPDYKLLSNISKIMLALGLISMVFLWFPN